MMPNDGARKRGALLGLILGFGLAAEGGACSSGSTGSLDLFPESSHPNDTKDAGGSSTTPPCTAPSCASTPPHAHCTSAADCQAPRPICDQTLGACVECSADAECAAGTRCDTLLHTCAPGCTADSDCRSGSMSRCESTSGRCVECLTATDCTSGDRPLCGSSHACVQCETDLDCHDASKPGCVVSRGRCDECSKDSQCPQGSTCNITDGQCR